jgi:hypothetical protein
MLSEWGNIVGKCFHSLGTDGYVQYQGKFLAQVEGNPGLFVAELAEWLVGQGGSYRVFELAALARDGIYLYETAEEMREAYDEGLVPRRPSRAAARGAE